MLHLRRQSRHVKQGSSVTLCTYINTAIYKYEVHVSGHVEQFARTLYVQIQVQMYIDRVYVSRHVEL